MSHMFKNSLAALAFLAGLSAAQGQEQIVGSGVYIARGMNTPVMATFNLPSGGTSSAAQYAGQSGSWISGNLATTATVRAIPIPISGKIKNLYSNLNAAQSPAAKITANINGTDATVNCTYATTAPYACSDTSDADPVNSGDLFNWHWTTGSNWVQPASQATPQPASFIIQSPDQHGAIFSGPAIIAGTVVSSYSGVWTGAVGSNTTESQASSIMPTSFSITGLYVYPNATENTTPHSYTVCVNNSVSACTAGSGITCTPTASTSTGCCVNNYANHGNIGGGSGPACGTATPITVNSGDTLSILVNCPGGACAAVNPGMSLSYVPSIAGQAILNYQAVNYNPTSFPNSGLMGTVGTAANVWYQLAPSNIVFSNLIVCSSLNPGAGGSRVLTHYSGSGAGVPPATAQSLSVAFTNGNACPGANGTALPGGNKDATDSWTAAAGSTVANVFSVISTPSATNANYKIGVVGVAQ